MQIYDLSELIWYFFSHRHLVELAQMMGRLHQLNQTFPISIELWHMAAE